MRTGLISRGLAIGGAAIGLALAVGSMAQEHAASGRGDWKPEPFTDPSAIAYHRLAVDVAGKDWPTTLAFRCNANWPAVETGIRARGPVKIFDNLYYLGVPGIGEVTAWAITTSAGIVIIDTLSSPQEARDVIVGGLIKLGLNPKNIRYVLLTHEHLDHYGGANYLREQFHPIFAMSQAAWDAKPKPFPGADPTLTLPTRQPGDIALSDGQQLTIGDTTITTVLTPGHTPGTTSFIIPVKDHGTVHMAALMGGNRPGGSVEKMRQFRRSLDHFEDYTAPARVDVELAIHGDTDNMLHRLDLLKQRKAGDPNPFVVGREKYLRYEAAWKYCLDANIAQGKVP